MWFEFLKHHLVHYPKPKGLNKVESEFILCVKNSSTPLDDRSIISLLSDLKQNHKKINITDFGAGSRKNHSSERKISDIAKQVSISPKFGKLYAQIIEHYKYNTAIELGTSLGIGTSYLALNAKQVITLEGCPNISKLAAENFKSLDLKNIEILIGEFNLHLKALISKINSPVFIYVDGNHQYEPTMAYYHFFIKHAPENSCLVFDDIYWSKEMKKAWKTIQLGGYLCVDLFRAGLVFKTKSTQKKAIKIKL